MIGIHQSQFMPWSPFFFKMLRSDIFVVLDHVQFQKNGVQNRNMIKTPNGAGWITVPVTRSLTTKINEVRLAQPDIGTRILKILEMGYRESLFFHEVYGALGKVLNKRHEFLHQLNMELLEAVLGLFQVNPRIIFSSALGTTQSKGELVIEIIKRCDERHYLSGQGALVYMDLERFRQEGIEVSTYNFSYAQYPQLWTKTGGFVPDLSVVDLLFNHLPYAKEYILGNGTIFKEVV